MLTSALRRNFPRNWWVWKGLVGRCWAITSKLGVEGVKSGCCLVGWFAGFLVLESLNKNVLVLWKCLSFGGLPLIFACKMVGMNVNQTYSLTNDDFMVN